ncbi:hypothetical protein [Lacticaseibacillus paracasei]|uniref:hypothetical protein n=1 Tax=Lacticaseibacillus paracasei TaxID=1597 RepID=UPI001F50A654|nr:hypothetical protein [Lacticaseibacillus paracasei]MCI0374711.1 hypothetical protein [Lacticaseibacillus paracasei]MCI0375740.1 hypothetical protein [Lacticaseibacillus paracasei]
MENEAEKILIDYAPYIAGIISALVAYFSYQESKRRTNHDELEDLNDRYRKEIDRLQRENDRLRKENNHE